MFRPDLLELRVEIVIFVKSTENVFGSAGIKHLILFEFPYHQLEFLFVFTGLVETVEQIRNQRIGDVCQEVVFFPQIKQQLLPFFQFVN